MAVTLVLLVLECLLLLGVDANSPPVLVNSIDLAVIEENTPIGTSVFQLQGQDPENSPVYYGIEGTNKLTADRETGIVKINAHIDREVEETIPFVVTLRDVVGGGSLDNVVKIPVTVIVVDQNDNSPRFHQVPYEAHAQEDTPLETVIFDKINVTDTDDVGTLLVIKCVFNAEYPDSCDTFDVVQTKTSSKNALASLVLKKPLDFSKNNLYQVRLQAEDGHHTSATIVTVKVGDVQNKPPVFVNALVGIVSEDIEIGTEVMVAKAVDGDQEKPRRINYELITNPGEFFSVDPDTGEISSARPLDREAFLDTNGIVTLDIRASEVVNGRPVVANDTSTVGSVSITIKDVNDEPPTFNLTSYSVEVNENLPNGTPLPGLDMLVQDMDIGTNSVFNLEVMDPSGIFSIEPLLATGSTSVSVRIANGPLDYENPNQRKFILLVIAREAFTEQKLSSTATVSIVTLDVNDNPPEFFEDTYRAHISESAPPGTVVTTITATDRDKGAYGEKSIVYSLFGNGADRFSVNPSTGVITVAPCETPGSGNCLDFETHSRYLLSYQAVDENGLGHTTVVPIAITLTDADDNPPYFVQSLYQAVINEGAMGFEPQLFVKAKDNDVTSVPKYSIIAGNHLNLFAISAVTGEITLAGSQPLDAPNLPNDTIVLTVQARDSGQGLATTTVKITVRDSNNNKPVFEKETYLATIPESSPPGTLVQEVLARDADTGVNAQLSYRINRGGFDDFRIEPSTGVIKVAEGARLDFDRRREYEMEVVAVDGGAPSHTGTTVVIVQLLNDNDKAPYFTPTTQKAEISEGAEVGHVFYKLKAQDPDVTSPDFLRYASTEDISALDKDGRPVLDDLSYRSFFSVDTSSGVVRVSRNLDRDVAAVVTMKVILTDTSATPYQTGTGTLVVIVIDRNDYPPSFSPPWTRENPTLDLHVIEEQPVGTVVGSVMATDPDSNIAGYKIIPENLYVAVDGPSGVLTIRSRIDYEEVQQIQMQVFAYDSGIPQLSAMATVTINVVNINDNDPIFSQESYMARILENSREGTVVTGVVARDLDAGDFGKLHFSVIGERAADFIIYMDGSLRVAPATLLDRETMPRITIQVVATDQGQDISTRRSRSVPVYIQLVDENDNPPVFTEREYKASIVANVSLNPPTPVVQVIANDADEGINAKIKYTILSGNEDETFRIDPDSGVVYPLKQIADYLKEFRLKIRAEDKAGDGLNFDECLVHVTVVEINQDKPRFVVPYSVNATVEIPENQNMENFLVMTVKALDNDRGDNGRVSYYLKVGDRNVEETDEFQINPRTGELRTRVLMDREKKAEYQLILSAKDNGSPVAFETLNSLTVVLKDLDDNVPQFHRTQLSNPYVFALQENLGANAWVGRVTAVDLDSAENSVVYYHIVEASSPNKFKIDRMYGDIYSNASFDRETEGEFELVVKATSNANYRDDQQVAAKSPGDQEKVLNYKEDDLSLAWIKIRITDMNDNAPKFTQEAYHIGLRDTVKPGEVVLTATAFDPDEGQNGSLTYQLESVNLFRSSVSGSVRPIPSPFNISQKGVVMTTELMSQYNHAHFHLVIAAQEAGHPHRVAKITAKVWVYQQDQLVKVIFTHPPDLVNKHRTEFVKTLSAATGGTVIIDNIRYHVAQGNKLQRKWTDLYIYVVDREEKMLPLVKVLENVDINAELLKQKENVLQIHHIIPAYATLLEEEFEPALAALIALLVVLCMGVITAIICCFCLKSWYTVKMQKAYGTVRPKKDVKTRNTIENPLWTDQKLKLYEEQELSMCVAPDNPLSDKMSVSHIPDDNVSAVYATLRRSTANSLDGGSQIEGFHTMNHPNEYATLNGLSSVLDPESPISKGDEMPAYHELRNGGSTSQPGSSNRNLQVYEDKDLVTQFL